MQKKTLLVVWPHFESTNSHESRVEPHRNPSTFFSNTNQSYRDLASPQSGWLVSYRRQRMKSAVRDTGNRELTHCWRGVNDHSYSREQYENASKDESCICCTIHCPTSGDVPKENRIPTSGPSALPGLMQHFPQEPRHGMSLPDNW